MKARKLLKMIKDDANMRIYDSYDAHSIEDNIRNAAARMVVEICESVREDIKYQKKAKNL